MRFLISALVGAVIGYITNWLAIKMLFRPYEEKRIFNIKVPFTPGLIPKERYRVASSVGDTVGNYLLTPDKFKELLEEDSTRASLVKWIVEKKEVYEAKDLVIKDILFDHNIINDDFIMKISKNGYEYILDYMKSDKFKVLFISYLDNIYDDISEKIVEASDEKLLLYLKTMLSDENIEDGIINILRNFDSNKSIRDLLKDNTYIIEDLIDKNKKNISLRLREILNEEEIRKEIFISISRTVEKNVSPLIRTFVSTDNISNKIIASLYEYINSQEFEELIEVGLDRGKEEILSINIKNIHDYIIKDLGEDKLKELYSDIINIIFVKIEENSIDKAITNRIQVELKAMKVNIISEIYRYMITELDKDSNKAALINKTYDFILILLNTRLNVLLDYLTEDMVNKYVDKIFKYLEDSEYKVIINILNIIDIPKIVEDQINSFELDFAEELILDIAGKELKAITNLGAVLGAVIGLINPLLQMIY